MGRGTLGSGADELSEVNNDILSYVSEKAREKFKLIGPFEPEGFDVVNKDEEFTELNENGTYYKGHVNKQSKKKQGFGMLAAEECLYEGFFKNGKRFGAGRIILASGDVQEGNYINNQL